MYKLLLCWRYLWTRYIALASIVSVTLGVATLIVVNGVMAGFQHEMQARIHGILSDLVFESHTMDGFYDAQQHMERIQELAGEYIAGMTPTVAVPAQLTYEVDGRWHTKHISFIGVDQESYGAVSDFHRYLKHPENRKRLSFELHDGGYDTSAADADGWPHRRDIAARAKSEPEAAVPAAQPANAVDPPETIEQNGFRYRRVKKAEPAADAPPANPFPIDNPFRREGAAPAFDPATQTHTGLVLGIGLSSVKTADGKQLLIRPGDDVKITVPTAATPPKFASDTFTVVDLYESQMSEYDSNFIFAPIEKLQQMRAMIEPQSGIGYVTAIQIKLRRAEDCDVVRDLLRRNFPASYYGVHTWRDKQGPLLAAVGMQATLLNILLFLIIAVAGFGILAIFCMIVVEKTKDIGVLKSLGASSGGILEIFLAYGLSLGMVGAGAGLVIGLVFVANINNIADKLAQISGREVFDPSIYYFQEIPTIVEPWTVVWIVLGAMLIAVLASIVPAVRAAGMHPVEALRHV